MLKNSPAIILCDDMLGVLVGKGCKVDEDGVGGGLGKCLGHDDICLTRFFMEDFSHRRYQKVKKLLGGINMV